jgi:hypothetical protein
MSAASLKYFCQKNLSVWHVFVLWFFVKKLKENFSGFFFLCTLFNTASSAAPHSTVSEDAVIEPSTVATMA